MTTPDTHPPHEGAKVPGLSEQPEVEGHMPGIHVDVPTEQAGVVEPGGGTHVSSTEDAEADEVEGHMLHPMSDRVAADRARDLLSEAERARRSDQANPGQGGMLGGLRDRLRQRGSGQG